MSGHGAVPAGWYHMQGDPAGTHRRWDGANWTSEVQAVQPVASAPTPNPVVAAPAPVSTPAAPVNTPVAPFEAPAMAQAQAVPASSAVPSAIADDPWANWETIAQGNAAGQATPDSLATQTTDAFSSDEVSPSGKGANPLRWMILPYQNYANFKGRSCRAEFWWFQLFVLVAPVLLFILGTAVSIAFVGEVQEGEEAGAGVAILAFTPLFLFCLLYTSPSPRDRG